MILLWCNVQKEKEEVQVFVVDIGEEQEDVLDLGKDGFDDLIFDEFELQVVVVVLQVEKIIVQIFDVLGEVDIYIVYGCFNQVVELLQNVIYDELQCIDLCFKLMEVYVEMGDCEGFVCQENELCEIGGVQLQVEQFKLCYLVMVVVVVVVGLVGVKLVQDELDSFSFDDLLFDDSGYVVKLDVVGQDFDDVFDLSLDDLGGDDVQVDFKFDSGVLDDLILDSDLDLVVLILVDKFVDDFDFGLDFVELVEILS